MVYSVEDRILIEIFYTNSTIMMPKTYQRIS